MSFSTAAGLTDALPPPRQLDGPHGALAFFAYPADRPWLHLLVSHGFGEHSGWWQHVALAFQAEGISTYLFDHYHHGQSAGAIADVPDYSHLMDGLRTVLGQGVAPERVPGTPLVLLGHSNGGLVTVLSLPGLGPEAVQGIVLCSPFLGFPPKARWLGTPLAWLLRRINPRLRVPLPNRPWRLTSNRALWPQYQSDPRRFRSITVRFFLAMRRGLAAARPITGLRGRPLLLLSAGREVVVSRRAMEDWFTRADSPDKARRHYPDLRHELFNEVHWEAVVADVLAWARERFQAPAPGTPAPAAD